MYFRKKKIFAKVKILVILEAKYHKNTEEKDTSNHGKNSKEMK
jgi:hypothetical protein